MRHPSLGQVGCRAPRTPCGATPAALYNADTPCPAVTVTMQTARRHLRSPLAPHGEMAASRVTRIALATLATTLAACTASHQPMGAARDEPRMTTAELITPDDARLPLRHWPAQGPTRAVVLALHGMNDYGQAFAAPAQYWAQHGVTTYAYDQRGFGASDRPGVWPDTATLVADLNAALISAGMRHPGVPIYALGESMGGAVIIAALAQRTAHADQPRLDGAILSAPALWGRQTMNPVFRLTLWAGYHTVPGMTLKPPARLRIIPSDNLDMLRALGRDPLVLKQTRLDALKGLVDLMTEAQDGVERLPPEVPILVLYGQQEQVLARPSVTQTLSRLQAREATAPLRVAIYDDGFHMLLRDLCAETVWRDALAWLDDPRAALPSGADTNAWQADRPERPMGENGWPLPPTCAGSAAR